MNITCGHGKSLVPRVIIKFLKARNLSTRTAFNVTKAPRRASDKREPTAEPPPKKSPTYILQSPPSLSAPQPLCVPQLLHAPSTKLNTDQPTNINTEQPTQLNTEQPPRIRKRTRKSQKAKQLQQTQQQSQPEQLHKPKPPLCTAKSCSTQPTLDIPLSELSSALITHPFLGAVHDESMTEDGLETAKKRNKNVKVFLGVSGGVDSSVSALLLKLQGFDVVGQYLTKGDMKCWDGRDDVGACQGEKDLQDAKGICDSLQIPFKEVDFVKEYWQEVFSEFLSGYQHGITPNPDVICNKKIKFHHFLNFCLNNGADLVATGHYARVGYNGEGEALLCKAQDLAKDQSYFLSSLSSKQLERVIFPVGELTKAKVRNLAEMASLPTAQKKNSVGLCFVGKRSIPEFLSQYIDGINGQAKTLYGKNLGPMSGINFCTIGQRARLSGQTDRLFICGIDHAKKIVRLCEGIMHPALYSDSCIVRNVNWVTGTPQALQLGGTLVCECQARYHQKPATCRITKVGDMYAVSFDYPHKVPAAGQVFVMYNGEVCLGSGIIEKAGPTYHDMERELPKDFIGDEDE